MYVRARPPLTSHECQAWPPWSVPSPQELAPRDRLRKTAEDREMGSPTQVSLRFRCLLLLPGRGLWGRSDTLLLLPRRRPEGGPGGAQD